ncbi:unnamed protein product [Echinostoma caproni]|uniref:GOLD domain-containing protein n=1 Tax=Echinostoma caproni TaxID=27848 RepID=A0A183AWN2_9TREM|nr:unnamed protein product [Echinostoma caproni]
MYLRLLPLLCEGIPEVARKLSASSHNQVTIMQPQPDRMCMTHVTSLGVVEMSFKFDEEFEYRGPDGEKLKVSQYTPGSQNADYEA